MKKYIINTLIVFSCFSFTYAQNAPSYVPSNGLIGWWPLDGDGNDMSGNGNNGTVNGATKTTDRFGINNSAYSLNGLNNFINLNTPLRDSFSVSLWVNVGEFKTYTAPGNNFIGSTILSTFHNNVPSTGFQISLAAPQSNYGRNWAAFWCNNGCKAAFSNNLISTGDWRLLTATYNGSSLKYYSNGILDTIVESSFVNNSKNVFIGAREYHINGPDFFFSGKVDDIGIWNRALTESEIKRLYNASLCFQSIAVTDTLIINVNRTGYNPITFENTLKVYPNPTKDKITIDNGNLSKMTGYSIKIMNSLGQQVFQSNINQQQFNIDITAWGGNGIYFLQLIDNSGNIVDIRKILLQ